MQDSTDDRNKQATPPLPSSKGSFTQDRTLGPVLSLVVNARARIFLNGAILPPLMSSLKDYVTEIPDFPKKGILFRDITTILSSPEGFKMAIDSLVDLLKGVDFDLVVGTESRGFIFGAPVAYALGKGFILVRKKGKLPRETVSESYDLEYGQAEIEMHTDAIKPGQRVVLIDDLIATGGTTEAVVKLVEKEQGVVVKALFVMELAGLNGREKLKGIDVESLIVYEGA